MILCNLGSSIRVLLARVAVFGLIKIKNERILAKFSVVVEFLTKFWTIKFELETFRQIIKTNAIRFKRLMNNFVIGNRKLTNNHFL